MLRNDFSNTLNSHPVQPASQEDQKSRDNVCHWEDIPINAR